MSKYADLRYLEGREIYIRDRAEDEAKGRPIRSAVDEFAPDRAILVKDYAKTVLVDIYYGRNCIRRMFTKAAMFCGDVIIKADRVSLIGEKIRS